MRGNIETYRRDRRPPAPVVEFFQFAFANGQFLPSNRTTYFSIHLVTFDLFDQCSGNALSRPLLVVPCPTPSAKSSLTDEDNLVAPPFQLTNRSLVINMHSYNLLAQQAKQFMRTTFFIRFELSNVIISCIT